MITVAELQAKAQRKFPDFLRYKIEHTCHSESMSCHSEFISESYYGERLKQSDRDNAGGRVQHDSTSPFFPLEIKADKGSASDNLKKRESEILPLIQKSKEKTGKGYTLIFEERKTRSNGNQSQLSKILFETEEDYLYFIKKNAETRRVINAIKILNEKLAFTSAQNLNLLWNCENLSFLTENHENQNDFWENICLCVNYFLENPTPNLYIREIPLPVHTKFIENNKALILSLLSFLKNEENSPKLSDFENYCSLKEKPVFVRFRSLDKENPLKVGNFSLSELSLTLGDFEHFEKSGATEKIKKIFIIENEMVYLTFPEVKNALCIWGHGFSVTTLKNCEWLKNHELFYFGDLDEHGFLILSDFRKYFPLTKSFCMNGKILQDFNSFRTEGKILQGKAIPENLSEEEKSVFLELRENPAKNRLEQERISQGAIEKSLFMPLFASAL